MFANDVRKGMRVQLRNGWFGTMADNAKGNTRMVDVEGFCREIGSVYTHDIARVRIDSAGIEVWERVDLSPAQEKKAARIRAMCRAMGM